MAVTPLPTALRGGETILLVEDEESVRALTLYVLRAYGYAVIEARDGAEAMQLAAAHDGKIDLLVTDMMMPRMGGREVAETLAQHRPGLKALFLSGYGDDTEAAFLPKPFTPKGLAMKVREVLDARKPAEGKEKSRS